MSDIRKPDKNVAWMHFICKFVYRVGLGDYWYESSNRSTWRKMAYRILVSINHSYFFVMVCSEFASLFKTNILPVERKDAIIFNIAHILIPVKWLLLLIHKERIKKLIKIMLISTRELYGNEQIEKEQLRKSHVYCFALAFSMFFALTTAFIDSLVRYFRTGLPWRTIVTVYPDYDDQSSAAFYFRGFSTFFWYHYIFTMLSADFLAVTSLINLAFKFKILQSYFVSLGTRFEQNPMEKSQEELEDEMRCNFVKGIKLHKDMLWCADRIQSTLGNAYSCVVFQSTGLIAISMIKMVTDERNLMFLFATCMFIVCMLVLCGVYMWSAGEVTYEASLVSDAMFQSGWHLCSARARMRTLVVVGIIRSQVPIIMTAFGVFDLSYDNFIKILKTSYSVFAVFY